MLPITGPFHKYRGDGASYWFTESSSMRQVRPYNLPLDFVSRSCYVTKNFELPMRAISSGEWAFCENQANQLRTKTLNKAYERFQGRLGEQAAIAVNIAQWGQARDMMTSRLLQMADFGRNLRRGNIRAAVNVFKTTLTPSQERKVKRYNRSKDLSSQWLEYSFGWAPAVSDIYSATQILQSEPVWARISGTATTHLYYKVPPANPLTGTPGHLLVGKVVGRVAADVRVDNPNLFLANRLGILNPAAVVYELIPWSFLLGWVSNIEQFIGSWTDLAGVRLDNPYYSYHWVGTKSTTWYPSFQNSISESMSMKRVTGLYRPAFMWKPLRFSLKRAANAIALLLLQLPKK